jgi:hypothetical protein
MMTERGLLSLHRSLQMIDTVTRPDFMVSRIADVMHLRYPLTG